MVKKRVTAWSIATALLVWLWIAAGAVMGSILGLYGLDGSVPYRLVGLTLLLLLASGAYDLAGGVAKTGKSVFIIGIAVYFVTALVAVVGIVAIRLVIGG